MSPHLSQTKARFLRSQNDQIPLQWIPQWMCLWCFISQGTSLKNAFLANVVQVNTQMEQMCERKMPPSEFPLLVPFVWWGFWHLVFGPLTGWLRCVKGGRGSLTVPCYQLKDSVSGSFPSSAPAHQTIHRFCVSRPEDGIVCVITKPCFWWRVSGIWKWLCVPQTVVHTAGPTGGLYLQGRVILRTTGVQLFRLPVPCQPPPSTAPTPKDKNEGREEGRKRKKPNSGYFLIQL